MRSTLSRAARLGTVLALVGGATVISPGPAAAAPAGQVTVDVMTVNGSGCPNGTADVTMSPGNTAFTVRYRDYVAYAGGNAEATDSRKNCQLAVHLDVPKGYTFAIAKATYRGFASLEQGATGQQRAYYYFQGRSETAVTAASFSGPLHERWESTDTALLVYRPCAEDRLLNINTDLRVQSDSPAKTSLMAMDSTRGSVDTLYHLAWKRCG